MKYKINDQIPNCEVFQLIDGNPKKFKINDFFKDNIDKIRSKGIDKVFCISVNDPYVMNAWAKISKVENEIIMIADPFGNFANKLGVLVNKDAKGLGMRSSRYTMIIENKVIKYVAVEKLSLIHI